MFSGIKQGRIQVWADEADRMDAPESYLKTSQCEIVGEMT